MKISKRARVAVAVTLVAIIAMAGVAVILSGGTTSASDRMQVVATIYPLYYFSSEIGGDLAKVTMLIPDNSEPHSWEPTASDMIVVDRADVLVYNGAGFEPWLPNLMDAVDTSDLTVVDSSKNVHLLLSGEIDEAYEAAVEVFNGGAASTVAASSNPSEARTVNASGYVDIGFTDVPGGHGGYLKVVPSVSGDLRFFVTNATDLTITASNGTELDYELENGPLASYPMFNGSKFVELEAGEEYTFFFMSGSSTSTGLITVAGVDGEDEHGLNDPHIWLDPLSAKVQVQNILNGFIEADPDHASTYRANAANLTERLDLLNKAYEEGLANRTKNTIITTHEAFDYLASRYGFEAYAAKGISADSQPSLQDMAALVQTIEKYGLKYVYAEPTYNDAEIRTIASETGATVLLLDDAAARSGVHAHMDYFEIMYANLEQLRIGLEVTS